MVSYFRINVAQNGIYLFATEQGRLTNSNEAKKVYDILKIKFSKSEGYSVTCTHWQGHGKEVNWEDE